MNIQLSNPKTFLALLLFVGFVFSLIGLGWWSAKQDSLVFWLGIGIIFLAVVLWIYDRYR